MLDITFIRENKNIVEENIRNRKMHVEIEKLLNLDDERRSLLKELEQLRAVKNKSSKAKPSQQEIEEMKSIGKKIKDLEKQYETVFQSYENILKSVPNMTDPESPVGSECDFKIVEVVGKPFTDNKKFELKTHDELMTSLNLIDFERGAKIAGSKYFFAKNDLVMLNQSLILYASDIAKKYDYKLIETPDLAKNEILLGIGFNPRGEETQVYSLENTDLSLIGTAEITMGGYHANEVLDLSAGPKKYVALSHCFRTEAGAYGKASRGLYRIHQFTKLELFVFCKPEDSQKLHKEILKIEKEICNGLEIPYRVIDIATADLGASAFKKYDIEGWMTMIEEKNNKKIGGYGEITSCSNCTDYQSRRLNIKYRTEKDTNKYVHTLNGTAMTSSRFPLVIFENHQQKDGSIKIPKKLRKYFGKKYIK
jgi:seryl-tRNA synthetase